MEFVSYFCPLFIFTISLYAKPSTIIYALETVLLVSFNEELWETISLNEDIFPFIIINSFFFVYVDQIHSYVVYHNNIFSFY